MHLRRFNTDGIAAFQTFIDSHTGDHAQAWPEGVLSAEALTEAVGAPVILEHRAFATRFELAEYLHHSFEEADFRPTGFDAGLWAWIACFYFQEICPISRGTPQPGSAPRWIPQSRDWRRYYRHLVAGPYGIYQAHRDAPERAMALLCQRPGRPGDLVEQLASRQQVVTNATIMDVATRCFVNTATGQQRKSANSKGPGGARRFIDVLNQFDVTWDFSMMSPEELRARMPPEFDSAASAQ